MQRKTTTIKLQNPPHENFVLVSKVGERSKEEVFKIIEKSIKNNEVKKAIKITHKEIQSKSEGYEEHKFIPALSYQFKVNSRGDKETIRVIANEIDKADEARLDAMCDEVINVKQRANSKTLIKVLATATLITISIPFVKIAVEKMENDSIVEAFNDYKTMQQNIVRENARRENSNMPRINTFGEELPTDINDLNALSSIYKENLQEEYKMSPELEAITKKYYSNQALTVEEMEIFLDDFYGRKDIYRDSVEEFNELHENEMKR